ncbi:MAG: threonine--tRNA ligase [candidate division Zixibacteria bacterium]|nr:threonine--tRNA ligase [candidate division Zixibacteria bacterium]
MQITFPDGSVKQYEPGTTGYDIASAISPRLAKAAIAVKVNGEMRDLNAVISDDASVEILTFDKSEGKKVFWHSSSHIMAQAVQELFPGVKLAIGPSIDEGWYYDFDVEKPFLPDDLKKIEGKMGEIIKENSAFSSKEIARSDAIEQCRRDGEEYKIELLEDIEDETVTFYYHSRFKDLCRGPHIPRTGIIKAFKLTSTSGAYWRGDERRPMLQRIYGVSYPKKAMLDDYLYRLEEAKKRDHRVLGKQLELYSINDEVGAGLVLWHPKGARVRNEIENFWREEHLKNGYELVFSPHIALRGLWERSGHTDFYSDSMLSPVEVEGRFYQLKPMNCPFHIYIYKSRLWSYRDLPLRWAELGAVYRFEPSGVLHGLMRVRGFTQDDAHHFVTQENMEEEVVWVINFCVYILSSFGFSNYDIYLSTRPEKSIGEAEDWERAERSLRFALEKAELAYQVDEGGGAFYGPKIDIKIKDALNRSWQCSTIQFDFSLPERFDLYYIDEDGRKKRPYMIHRALLGSIERFFGVLVEHYAGNFPLWLAPVQVKIMPVTDSFNDFGCQVVDEFTSKGIRAVIDDRSEKIGAKIRDAELMKVPYMCIVGAREAESKTVSLRKHGVGDLGSMTFSEAVALFRKEIDNKGLDR